MPNKFKRTNCRPQFLFGFSEPRLIFDAPKAPEKAAEGAKTEAGKVLTVNDLEDALPAAEVGKAKDKIEAGKDSVNDAARAKTAELAAKIGIGVTPKNTPPPKPPGAPDIGQRSPEVKQEKLTGSQFLAKLKEQDAKDKAAGIPLNKRLQKMKDLAVEQAKIGNIYHDGWSDVNLGEVEVNGQKLQVRTKVTNRYISIGNKEDHFMVPVDGPAAKLMAEAAGGVMPTLKVLDAIEDPKNKGQMVNFIAGPKIAADLLKTDPTLPQDVREKLNQWKTDPNHPPGEMMQWLGMFAAHNDDLEKRIAGIKSGTLTYGGSKTPIINPNFQDEGTTKAKVRLSESLSIAGGVDVNGKRVQQGTGNPHGLDHLDYSQRAIAMGPETELVDPNTGKILFKVKTADMMKGPDADGNIKTVDGLKIKVPDSYKPFSNRTIDLAKIYPGHSLGKEFKPKVEAPTDWSAVQPLMGAGEQRVVPATQEPFAARVVPSLGSAPSSKPEVREASSAVAVGYFPERTSAPSSTSTGTSKAKSGAVEAFTKPEIPSEDHPSTRRESFDLTGSAEAPKARELFIPEGKKLFIFGDSHSDGFGNVLSSKFADKIVHLHSSRNKYSKSESQTMGNIRQAFDELLSGKYPADKFPGAKYPKGAELDNLLNGSTVVLEIGTNDLFAGKTFEAMKTEFESLVSLLKSKGMKVVVGTIPAIKDNDQKPSAKMIQTKDAFNEYLRGKYQQHQIDELIDLQKLGFETADGHTNPDFKGSTLHLNPKGYAELANRFALQVNKVNGKIESEAPSTAPSKADPEILAAKRAENKEIYANLPKGSKSAFDAPVFDNVREELTALARANRDSMNVGETRVVQLSNGQSVLLVATNHFNHPEKYPNGLKGIEVRTMA
ncbi:MAG: SGNH/GDSL hydrolase family protein [Candidatus Gracilibacteria bacterium]|jgi:hypothetical protein